MSMENVAAFAGLVLVILGQLPGLRRDGNVQDLEFIKISTLDIGVNYITCYIRSY